jgi:hypothetical protein
MSPSPSPQSILDDFAQTIKKTIHTSPLTELQSALTRNYISQIESINADFELVPPEGKIDYLKN